MGPVLDSLALPPRDANERMHLFRNSGQVQLQQLCQVLLDALVVGSQGQEDLPQFLPPLFRRAVAESRFSICVGRNDERADDVTQGLVGSGAHGATDGLDNVDGALAGF